MDTFDLPHVDTRAQHLLFFELDLDRLGGTVIFNGPEQIALKSFPASWIGQRQVSALQIRAANAMVKPADRLLRIEG